MAQRKSYSTGPKIQSPKINPNLIYKQRVLG